jgi:C4-dicarboxylate transporter DctM subunit
MDVLTISVILLACLALFLGTTVWVGISLFIIGAIGFFFFTSVDPMAVMANIVWNGTSGSTMIALPLFILMGEILFKSKISENLFKGLSPWMDKLPGRLVHVNIFACTLFAAVSGSSAATTATVGKITLPELLKRNYDRGLCLGSLAGAGTLGFLIPPSMVMLVYGIVADVSIGKLFIAGIIPGVLLAAGFSGYVLVRCLINPRLAPPSDLSYTWSDRLKTIPQLLPVVLLIVMVLGSIYLGWATPTEAAAVGVVGSIFFAFLSRSMDWGIFKAALMGAVKTSCMIMLICAGASFLSVAVGYLGIPAAVTKYIATLGVSPYTLIAILSVMYLIMGCLLDGFSMIVMSLPIAAPLIKAAGFDPVWFGIYLVIMIELAQITPPVGFNLFVINGLVGDDLFKISRYALPSFLIMVAMTALITVYPDIVLFIPKMMIK